MAFLLAPLVTGCASYHIEAATMTAPVSASGALFGPGRSICYVGQGLEWVGRVELMVTHRGLLWGTIELDDPRHDISQALAESLAAQQGDGIVNLTVNVRFRPWYTSLLAAMIPLVPVVSMSAVEGDVVRFGPGCQVDDTVVP